MTIKVGIIGCGLIGRKRARALGSMGQLIACADVSMHAATELAKNYNAEAFTNADAVIFHKNVDVVMIATRHDSLASITQACIKAGKHILVEKPAARWSKELEPILSTLENSIIKVHVGFNHRYHRAFRKAREIFQSGELGELMFIRARYGHGGRLGYEKEWRADAVLSGGGELIDQGPHVIDLSRWFLGNFVSVDGFSHTYYWDMAVDDNAFLTLKTQKNQVAFLHVSCSEWKNTFSMEIYGKTGKLEISGLGGSYGIEKLTFYKMLPQMGPPETTSWEYPMEDDSWQAEIFEFFEDIRLDRQPSATIKDAYETLKIIEQVYARKDHIG